MYAQDHNSSSSLRSAPQRPLGPAELLVEACFTDMRHGGDGDLTQAYKFAKKVSYAMGVKVERTGRF